MGTILPLKIPIAIVGTSQIKLAPHAVKTSSLGVFLYQKVSMKSGRKVVLQGPGCKNSLLPVVLTRIPPGFQIFFVMTSDPSHKKDRLP